MIRPSRRKAVAIMVLAATSVAVAEVWRPRIRLAKGRAAVQLETVFPKDFADWAVDDRQPVQLVSPDTKAMLDKLYTQLLSRTYVNSAGDRIMLSVAYGGDQSDATRTHRPEVCYPAQGFQVRSSSQGTVALTNSTQLPVRRLVTHLGTRVEPLTYWVVVGDRVVLTGVEQKLAQLHYGIRGVIPDGMLIRVSSIDPDTGRALALQERFVRDMAAVLAAEWRTSVLGAGTRSS